MASQLLERTSEPDLPQPGSTGAELVRFYRDLARLDDTVLCDALGAAIDAEIKADVDERRRRVMARLRAWAEMHTADARRFAQAYEAIFDTLPAGNARALEMDERDAAMNGLRMEEFERVRAQVPSLREWKAPARPQSPYFDRLSAVLAALEMDMALA